MSAQAILIFDSFQLDVTDEKRDLYIDLAKPQTGAGYYGVRYDHALALRAAHNLVLSDPDEYSEYRTGSVTMKREGGQTIQYAGIMLGGSAVKTTLSQTTFGTQLWELMRMSGLTVGVANKATDSFGVCQ